jgi:hypothetical protein
LLIARINVEHRWPSPISKIYIYIRNMVDDSKYHCGQILHTLDCTYISIFDLTIRAMGKLTLSVQIWFELVIVELLHFSSCFHVPHVLLYMCYFAQVII